MKDTIKFFQHIIAGLFSLLLTLLFHPVVVLLSKPVASGVGQQPVLTVVPEGGVVLVFSSGADFAPEYLTAFVVNHPGPFLPGN